MILNNRHITATGSSSYISLSTSTVILILICTTTTFLPRLAEANRERVPPGVCETFEIGHPLTMRSDATVKLELLNQSTLQSVACYKEDENYTLRISVNSADKNKFIRGLMINSSVGEFDAATSSPPGKDYFTTKLCESYNVTALTHTKEFKEKQINLTYMALSNSNDNDTTLIFNLSVVFEYNDYIAKRAAEGYSVPKCIPEPICIEPDKSSCPSLNKTVKRGVNLELFNHLIDGIEYNCTSAKTVRKFTCDGSCEVQKSCHTMDEGSGCKPSTETYTCRPKTQLKHRKFVCIPAHRGLGPPYIEPKIWVPVEHDCTCCDSSYDSIISSFS